LDVYVDYEPFPGTAQEDFWACDKLYPAYAGPAGIGKSLSGAAKIITAALLHPRDYVVAAPTWHNHLLTATLPAYEKLIPREVVEFTAEGKVFHRTDKKITLKTVKWHPTKAPDAVSHLWFRSTEEPESFYGGNWGGFHFDEAGGMPERAMEIARFRMRDNSGPLQGIFTFTPRANKKHWTYSLFGKQYEKAQEMLFKGVKRIVVDDPLYPVFSLHIENNPALPKEVLVEAKRRAEVSKLARQEYYGEYIDVGGTIYESFDPNVHVRLKSDDVGFVRVVAGVDFGRQAPTVIIVVGQDTNGYLWWCHEFYRAQCLQSDFLTACADIRARYPAISFYCDPSGKTDIQMMRRYGIPAYKADNSLDARVGRIWELLDRKAGIPGMFVTPECAHSIDEFQSWSWRENVTRSDVVRYDMVEENAHCMDAGGYAAVALGNVFEPMRVIWGRERVAV
jgi:hypothetical protein